MKEQDQKKITVCFIIASGLVLFFNLWGRSLEDQGYLRYAEVAREMVRSGDWIVPHLNGDIYINKPPLFFWVVALPASIYGSVTPFIAKFPSALSAWLCSILLFFWGRRVHGSYWAGVISGGVLLSTYQFFFQSRLAKTDTLFCLCIALSLYFFHRGFEEWPKRRYPLFLLSFLSMGFGTLTKGPFGFFIPLLIIAVFLGKEKRWNLLVSREFILGYLLVGLIGLPCVFSFVHRVGLERTITLIEENRFITRAAPVYFYFLEIWVEFLPWSVLFAFLAVYQWRRRERTWVSKDSFFLIWFVVLFILLTLFKYKVSRYLLPALPPVALMMGGILNQKRRLFLAVACASIVTFHVVDMVWTWNDVARSPGRELVRELKPAVRDTALVGYGLEEDVLEEVNFYFDQTTPLLNLKRPRDLCHSGPSISSRRILMSFALYEQVRHRGSLAMAVLNEFKYKKGRLVLVSIDCPVQ